MRSITSLYKFEFDEETMQQAVMGPSLERVTAEVARTIASDCDGKIRQALIDLGWTPPGQEKTPET